MAMILVGGAIGYGIAGTAAGALVGAGAGMLVGAATADAPQAPGTDPLVSQAAAENVQLGKDTLAFNKEQYADQKAYLDKLQPYIDGYLKSNQANLALTDQQNAQQFQDYQTLWRPNELAYLKDVQDAGSDTMQAEAAATAGAGVQSQIDMQRQATQRDMATMGVAPDAGRFEATSRVQDVLGAAARAGAENAARTGERDRGVAMRAGAVGVGRGSAQTALQGVQVGNQTASSGTGVGSTPISLGTQVGAAYNSGAGTAGNLISSGGNLALGGSSLNLAGWQASQAANAQQSQGIGGLLALGVNAYKAGMFTSDEDVKEDKKPVSGKELVKAVKSMRIERWKYKDGVADGGEHIGTYAQDFAKATGLGNGKAISVIDAIGVLQGALKQTIEDVASIRLSAVAKGVN